MIVEVMNSPVNSPYFDSVTLYNYLLKGLLFKQILGQFY